jgi:serine/threonine-protein kinase
MSPEQIDAGPVDARSDLYALGLVFYELLAGRPPFESSSPRELLNLQCTAPAPALPEAVRRGLPRGVERLVFELLEKKPDDRPGSAADVLHALEPFAPAEALPGVPSSRRRHAAAVAKKRSEPAASERAEAAERTQPSAPAVTPARTKLDTIALLERGTAPRDVSWRAAVAVVVALSVLSGMATYALRSDGRSDAVGAVSRGSP